MSEKTVSLRLALSCPQTLVGSLAWLRENAGGVRVYCGRGKKPARHVAVLLDREGKPLVRLACVALVRDEAGSFRVVRHCLSEADEPGCAGRILWTPAAWALLARLAEKVLGLLCEPAWLARRVEARLAGADERGRALLRAAALKPPASSQGDPLRDTAEPPMVRQSGRHLPGANGSVADDNIPF